MENERKPGRCDFQGWEVVCSGFTLEDCQEMNHLYPESFEVPSWAELNQLEPGSRVKLIVLPTDPDVGIERLWFEVIETPIDGVPGVAMCISAPVERHAPIDLDDMVVFERKDVAAIHGAEQ